MQNSNYSGPEKARYLRGRVRKVTNLIKEYYDENDVETSVTDCLIDLKHLCDAKGWKFSDLLNNSEGHYTAEKEGGEHG